MGKAIVLVSFWLLERIPEKNNLEGDLSWGPQLSWWSACLACPESVLSLAWTGCGVPRVGNQPCVDWVWFTPNPRALKMVTGGSEVHGHPQLLSESEASLSKLHEKLPASKRVEGSPEERAQLVKYLLKNHEDPSSILDTILKARYEKKKKAR